MHTKDAEVFVKLTEHQKKKLTKALQDNAPTSVRLAWDDLVGDHKLIVSSQQKLKMDKLREKGVGYTLKFTLDRLKRNKEIIGGFLPVLANIAKFAVPVLLGNLLGGNDQDDQDGEGLDNVGDECTCKCHTKGHGMYTHGAPPPQAQGNGMYTHGYAGVQLPVPVAVSAGSGMFTHGSRGSNREGIVPAVHISGGRVRKQKPKPEAKKKD